MTTRTDVDIDRQTSPRVLEVRAPSTEMVMQDLVDTARKLEDAFTGMGFDKLINASGKEDLGGGVKVGITVAMQNLLLAFAGRTTPAQTGIVTGSPANPISSRQTLQDSSAAFVTNGVRRGSLVINFTDQSIADVIAVNSETEIETKVLVNGIGNTYATSDVYHIFNIFQCNATGGNLVAQDDLQATIAAILPTAFTQVILTSSSSATLQEQADIQYIAFRAGSWIDVLSGNSGTEFPNGTPRQPVNNIPDAHAILTARGFNDFYVRGDLTISAGVHPHIWHGESIIRTTITVEVGADMTGAQFVNCALEGVLDGNNVINNCEVEAVSGFDGEIRNSGFDDTLTLSGNGSAHIVDCWSEVAGAATPMIDMNGSGTSLVVRNWQGGLEIVNRTGTDPVSIDMSSGHLILAATCTAGTIIVRGIGKLTDNSGVGCTVDTSGLIQPKDLTNLRKLMQNRMETDQDTGIMTIYDDDDTTVLLSGNIYEDVLAAQAYRGRGMERRNRLT